MRNSVNISLPSKMAEAIDKEIQKGKFSTRSEFFRTLIRRWEEDKLLAELEQSRSELRAGKGKRLRSLKDLR